MNKLQTTEDKDENETEIVYLSMSETGDTQRRMHKMEHTILQGKHGASQVTIDAGAAEM